MYDVQCSACHAVLGQRRVLDVLIFSVHPNARDLVGGRTIMLLMHLDNLEYQISLLERLACRRLVAPAILQPVTRGHPASLLYAVFVIFFPFCSNTPNLSLASLWLCARSPTKPSTKQKNHTHKYPARYLYPAARNHLFINSRRYTTIARFPQK